MSHELVHGVEIEYPGMSDVVQRIPLALLIENLAFFGPDFPHLPIIAGVIVIDFPAGFCGFAHGFFVIVGVCEVE
jgi:hypothetical protein